MTGARYSTVWRCCYPVSQFPNGGHLSFFLNSFPRTNNACEIILRFSLFVSFASLYIQRSKLQFFKSYSFIVFCLFIMSFPFSRILLLFFSSSVSKLVLEGSRSPPPLKIPINEFWTHTLDLEITWGRFTPLWCRIFPSENKGCSPVWCSFVSHVAPGGCLQLNCAYFFLNWFFQISCFCRSWNWGSFLRLHLLTVCVDKIFFFFLMRCVASHLPWFLKFFTNQYILMQSLIAAAHWVRLPGLLTVQVSSGDRAS